MRALGEGVEFRAPREIERGAVLALGEGVEFRAPREIEREVRYELSATDVEFRAHRI